MENKDRVVDNKGIPIFLYFIKMLGLFVFIFIVQSVFTLGIQGTLLTSKYGSEAMYEILWSGLVLVVVLLFKNKYIFTEKRESFKNSIKYIVPELILSVIFLVLNVYSLIISGDPIDFSAIFNLVIYSLFIGIVEEFLCRGWLLNEFLERYSNNRREVILSICFSAFIFGVIHFFNMNDTQGIAETLVQVMNAAAGGVFLAFAYYKTKNIWIVVFSHAFWDFSIFIGDVNSLGDCLVGTGSNAMIICNVIRGFVLTGAYLCFSYWLYVKTDLYKGEKKGFHKALVPVGIVVYLIGILFISVSSEGYSTCPEYTRNKIEDSYSVSYYNYSSYNVNDYDLTLRLEKGKVILVDGVSKESIVLSKLVDGYSYLLVDNDDSYSILIQVGVNSVLYGNYSKSDISYNKEYLKSVKKNLNINVTSDIGGLGTLKIKDSNHLYPVVVNSIGEYLYFDKDNKLYINS